MRIEDMTNLCDNGTFEQDALGARPSDWSSGRVVNNGQRGGLNPSARCLAIPAMIGNSHGTLTRLIAVNPGDQLQIELLYCFANTVGTGSLRVGFMLHNPARAYMGWYHRPPVGRAEHPPARTTVWRRGEWHLTIPPGVGFIRLDFYFSGNGETTNHLFLDNIVVRRRLGGQLIVEGEIRAHHIAARSITADRLTANAITVGFNSLGNTLRLSPTEITFSANGTRAGMLTGNGLEYWWGARDIGRISHNQIVNHPNVRGLNFGLRHTGDYLAFGFLNTPNAPTYTNSMMIDPWGRWSSINGPSRPGVHVLQQLNARQLGTHGFANNQDAEFSVARVNGEDRFFFGSPNRHNGIGFNNHDFFIVARGHWYNITHLRNW